MRGLIVAIAFALAASTAAYAQEVKVVGCVLKRRGVDKVNLVGWSWGTAIPAAYTADNQGKVERLALYAPVWLRTTPSLVQIQGKVGAYRVVSREQALGRWLTGVPED